MAEYYFNLPPITQLTISQQAALSETRQIALSGGPGTGKSVVSLWRHIANHKSGKNSLLLTYTTTLAEYLTACCRPLNANAANAVGTSLRKKPRSKDWSEVIIDEAQDLDLNYYQGIQPLVSVSYGADDSQILYPNCCSTQSQLKSLFSSNVDYVLDKNFRSTQRIMKFAKIAFPNAYIPHSTISGLSNNMGELPVLLITNGDPKERTNSKQDESIGKIITAFRSDTHNIAILVPWKSDVPVFEEVLKNKGVEGFSVFYNDDSRFPNGCESISNVHITTFKSAKGLEFDTVIIPKFNRFMDVCGRYNIEWKDYYVACTRARSNLYLISDCDMPQFNSVTDKEIL